MVCVMLGIPIVLNEKFVPGVHAYDRFMWAFRGKVSDVEMVYSLYDNGRFFWCFIDGRTLC